MGKPKQDAMMNLADAMVEDILNAPDDELLREVEEDYGDPLYLSKKFDEILARAEPTLKERIKLYLRAVYGERADTQEEYLRARNGILDEMARTIVDGNNSVQN